MISPFSGLKGQAMRERRQHIMRLVAAAGLWPAALALQSATAAAQAPTLCVVCTEPDATYRCQADPNFPRPAENRLNLLCITEIAHAGQHGSCSVRRTQSACEGPLKMVAIVPPPAAAPTPPPPAIAPPRAASIPAIPASQPPPETKAAASGPPDTVEELAKRSAAQTKEQLEAATGAVGNVAKKTTGAVGDAASKSWKCLSSLFKDCN